MDDAAWQAALGVAAEAGDKYLDQRNRRRGGWLLANWPYLTPILIALYLASWLWPVRSAAPMAIVAPTPAAMHLLTSPIETTFFDVFFAPEHAAAASELAANIDQLDVQLHAEFGLVLPLSADKPAIWIDSSLRPSENSLQPGTMDALIVPSSVLSPTDGLSIDAKLMGYVRSWLVYRALEAALQHTSFNPRWQPLVNGFRQYLWLQIHSDYLVPRADHYQLQAWIAMSTLPGQRIDIGPMNGGDTTIMEGNRPNPEMSDEPALKNILFAEYLLTTYGRQRLPTLLVALNQYDSWEALSPAVYGISARELEAGWYEHLENLHVRSSVQDHH